MENLGPGFLLSYDSSDCSLLLVDVSNVFFALPAYSCGVCVCVYRLMYVLQSMYGGQRIAFGCGYFSPSVWIAKTQVVRLGIS